MGDALHASRASLHYSDGGLNFRFLCVRISGSGVSAHVRWTLLELGIPFESTGPRPEANPLPTVRAI